MLIYFFIETVNAIAEDTSYFGRSASIATEVKRIFCYGIDDFNKYISA